MTQSMPCNEWSEKLAAQEETLSPSDRAALEAHLTLCPACSLALIDYQKMRLLLHTLPAPTFPAGLPPRLLQLWEEEAPADLTLRCSVCGQDFLFTAGDQAFFLQRGHTERPKRCPFCLRARMHGDVPHDTPHRHHEKHQ